MPVRINPRSLTVDIAVSVLAAVLIAVAGRSMAVLAIWMGAPEYWAYWSDDIFTGVVAGCVLLVALRNNSAKRRIIQKRLREILETNHNIRNALQVIGSSHLAATEGERLKMVTESVARIDRTLREFSVVDGIEESGGELDSKLQRMSSAKISREV